MIYADVNSSMPLLNEVKEYLANRIQNNPLGNPNALHHIGRNLNNAIEKSRKICAEKLGTKPENIIFNSGASEGIANIFYSVLHAEKNQTSKRIIISAIEHKAVLNTALHYKTEGFNLDIIPVDKNGIIDIKKLEHLIDKYKHEIKLVSIMAANNETGVIEPLKKISNLLQKHNICFFADTTQIFGKQEFNFDNLKLSYAVLSGHKIGALPGTGIIMVKEPKKFNPLIIGALQEHGYRGGTQNYIGIETLAVALSSITDLNEKTNTTLTHKNNFENKIKETFPEIFIAGYNANRLCNTTMLSYPGIHGQALQIELESHEIYVTTSSACGDNEPSPSHVLSAMNIPDDISRGMIRISSNIETASNDYPKIYNALCSSLNKLKKIKHF